MEGTYVIVMSLRAHHFTKLSLLHNMLATIMDKITVEIQTYLSQRKKGYKNV